MKIHFAPTFAFAAVTASLLAPGSQAEVTITVDPTTHRLVGGVGELDRQTVFSLCDPGKGFDTRVKSDERMEFLLDELNIKLGRALGPIKWSPNPKEDPDRPGFADIQDLESRLNPPEPGPLYRSLIGDRLDVVAHGAHNAYPEFMGQFSTEQSAQDNHHPQYLPDNIEAAAELAATVMAHNYTDFDRPRYFEPINEPHWSFYSLQELADWHLATQKAVHQQAPDVKVGGPCLSVAYFYKRNFGAFDGLKNFMANTNGELDFYSFHVYDYLRYRNGKVKGSVTSGLPLEGVLDLVQAHTVNTFGREYDIVVSEHGGYFLDPNEGVDTLAQEFLGEGEGFEHEMRVRSIASHGLVSSAIANTMTFLDHPHVVKKAVPFILLESMNWDPRYYSTAYVARDFTDKNDWVEARNLDFYRFFRDLSGSRVLASHNDPDLQVQAFADGNALRVIINNLNSESETVTLNLPEPKKTSIRRYERLDNFTPSLTESPLESLSKIEVPGRAALVITAEYAEPIQARRTINEVPHYADATQVVLEDNKPARFKIDIPLPDDVAYATLRIGVARPPAADPNILVSLNGTRLQVPLEDSAHRYTGEQEYASTKIIPIDPKLLKKNNRLFVTFPDEDGGSFGTAVIRAGYEQSN